MDNKGEKTKVEPRLSEFPNKLSDENLDCALWSENEGTAVKFNDMENELLLKIFYNFNSVPAEKIDSLINFTLKQIGELNNDDRCCIFSYSKDFSEIRNTHRWSREGIEDRFDNMQTLTKERNPWWMAQLGHAVIKIPKVSELPPEAENDLKGMQELGIRSLLIVPIICEGICIGYLGLDSVSIEKDWTDNTVGLLNVLAVIFGRALRRKEKILALAESENYYRALFETTGAATCIIADDMTIIKVNNECENIFGYTKPEMEGKKIIDFVEENDKKRIMEYHCARRSDTGGAPSKYEVRFWDKWGKVRDCMITGALIAGTKNSIVTNFDITRCSRLQRALRASSAINALQIAAQNENDLLEAVCEKLVEIGGYRFAWIGYVADDAKRSILPVAHAGHEEGYLKLLHINCTEKDPQNEVIASTMESGQPLICYDIATTKNFGPWRHEALKRGYKSLIAIPLYVSINNNNAVLLIYSDNSNVFDEEEVNLLKEIADSIVFGIKYLRTIIEQRKAAKELEKSFENIKKSLISTISAFSIQMESRDPYTVSHQKRVAFLSAAIAKEMGLSNYEIESIEIASTIHDIGKTTIPTDILCKPGKISELECMFIKTHSQAGYDIMKNIEFPWPVADLILQHHERLDGSGYPKGLKGDEIGLGARIIAVADVVEAMASPRPYRAALGVKKALEEIKSKKNIAFDREVVDVCLDLFNNKGFEFYQE